MFEIVYLLETDNDGEAVFGCSEIKLCELCGFAVKNIEGYPVKRQLEILGYADIGTPHLKGKHQCTQQVLTIQV